MLWKDVVAILKSSVAQQVQKTSLVNPSARRKGHKSSVSKLNLVWSEVTAAKYSTGLNSHLWSNDIKKDTKKTDNQKVESSSS